MDRTVPKTGSEEIQLYMRTYYSLLRSTHPIQIETLAESHMAMESSLHINARDPEPDISALVYSALRLPDVMEDVNHVLIGQVERSFVEAGYAVGDWRRVYAPGRRRRVHFDGSDTLAVFIASRSDIDDLVPVLAAYQIEWNKLHFLLQGEVGRQLLGASPVSRSLNEDETGRLAAALKISLADLLRLEVVWDGHFIETLHKIAAATKTISLRNLAGSLADYRRGTAYWWAELHDSLKDTVELENRPVYFVSSNTHSLVNLLTGFAQREERNLIEYIKSFNQGELVAEYQAIRDSDGLKSVDNFLYYVLRKYLADRGESARRALAADEQSIGIHRISSKHGFEIEAQVIEINRLRPDWLDPRLRESGGAEALASSDALILNIDYPLGLASYEILSRVTERVDNLLGVYVMGKAASLNGRIGDVMIPNVVHDEHSQNTYLFNNCFTAQDVAPYLSYGNVLDNQKSISALGTFLQNPRYMGVFYHEGYTIIEMEAGPYLSAVYEAFRPQRHPYNEIVNLYGVPFEVGFLYYASDTPMSKGHNLGAGSLSYAGIDPTYATAIAILHQIFGHEIQRGAEKVITNGAVVEKG